MKREFSAGGVVYKKEGGQILFLVRRSSGGADYRGSLGWTLPKGWIDEGETPEQAAVRETKEEGGVEAGIIEKLGTIKVFFADVNTREKVMKFITYYLMEYQQDTADGFGWETAETAWMGIKEATDKMAYDSEKKLVTKAWELLQSKDE